MNNVPHRVQWEHLDRAEQWTPWSGGLRENLAASSPVPVAPREDGGTTPPLVEEPAGPPEPRSG
jgi:hypothetical protein